MKEQELIDLGFVKTQTDDSYYYIYNLCESNYRLSLITNCADEITDNNFIVSFFESDIIFKLQIDIEDCIAIFERNKN